MHHFARFRMSKDGSLVFEVYATPGDGTPSFVYDTFTYSLGNSGSAQTTVMGDYDHNAVVSNEDYDIWRAGFGGIDSYLDADGNNDGTIDAGDYVLWRKLNVATAENS